MSRVWAGFRQVGPAPMQIEAEFIGSSTILCCLDIIVYFLKKNKKLHHKCRHFGD